MPSYDHLCYRKQSRRRGIQVRVDPINSRTTSAVDNHDRMTEMIRNANITITARENGLLIGVARSVSDFAFCTYLSDLAVDEKFQKQGIGKELIRRTKLEAPDAKLILLAAPAAREYYPKIGMPQFEYCFILDDVNQLK